MTFDYQPILTGDLLELRPLRAEDWDALYAVAADPLIWEQHPASDRHEFAVFQQFFRDAMASGGALLAIDRASGHVIGSSRFQRQDDERQGHVGSGFPGLSEVEGSRIDDAREVEIGWTFLARAYWGGVYNGEMKWLMLRHAFHFVDSVVFFIGPNNRRSRRAIEKIGATYDGTRIGGDGRESVRYRITASEFARRYDSGGQETRSATSRRQTRRAR